MELFDCVLALCQAAGRTFSVNSTAQLRQVCPIIGGEGGGGGREGEEERGIGILI